MPLGFGITSNRDLLGEGFGSHCSGEIRSVSPSQADPSQPLRVKPIRVKPLRVKPLRVKPIRIRPLRVYSLNAKLTDSEPNRVRIESNHIPAKQTKLTLNGIAVYCMAKNGDLTQNGNLTLSRRYLAEQARASELPGRVGVTEPAQAPRGRSGGGQCTGPGACQPRRAALNAGRDECWAALNAGPR